MVEVSLTVGKLDASLALLLTKDHHLIEFPTILLPSGVKAGSIVKIKCEQDLETEQEEARKFKAIQNEILNTFGKNLPKTPVLRIKNVTQTSCVLEWDELDLGTATLKNLFLFKDGKKLGAIPQALTNRTTKMSGLPIDKTFEFQLRLDTTAGVYSSDVLEVTTHKMTDLSGITVCLGDIGANENFTKADIELTLENMGAHHPAQTAVSVDTTHFICTKENKENPEYVKASDMNIPIIRPEWLKACERERRIVGVRDYYVKECSLPDIFAKNFWGKKDAPLPELPSEEPSTDGHLEPKITVTEATPEKSAEEPEETEPIEPAEENKQVEETAEETKENDTKPEVPAVEIEETKEEVEAVKEPEQLEEVKIVEPEVVVDETEPEPAAAKETTPEAVPTSSLPETSPEPKPKKKNKKKNKKK